MIEAVRSKSGHFTLKAEGRFLASAFDPVKEAQSWVRQAVHLVARSKATIVLGLGCGYHVAALKQILPQTDIYVLECDREVADQTLANQDNLSRVHIIMESDWKELLAHSALQKAVKSSFSLLPHAPSLALHTDFYSAAQRLLLSRDITSFLLQLRVRPGLDAELDQAKLSELIASPEPMTIHTLGTLFKKGSHLSRERRFWKTLEQLVA